MIGKWLTLSVMLAASLSGCSQGPAADGSSPSKTDQPILSGTEATDARYGAVGALMYETSWGLDLACSGTLIAPRAVVTSKGCTKYIRSAVANGTKTYFAFGFDAAMPEQQIEIVGYVAAPAAATHDGLLLSGGRDVAVAYLASAPVGITPAKLGSFQNSMVGSRFQIAGFGASDTWGTYGLRFAGDATARAISGQWYELLFDGDREAFLGWYYTDAPVAYPNDRQAQDWWRTYRLEPGYELLAGGLPGEALACYGDAGGPIFRGNSAQDLTVYGVSFAVEASMANICALGDGYLVFNKEMLGFVQSAIAAQ